MAKRMQMEVAHGFSVEEALERMQALGEYYENKFGGKPTWSGNAGEIRARYTVIDVLIAVQVKPDKVELEGPDPGMLLRKKAQAYIEGKVRSYLDPKTPVAALPRR